MTSDQFTNYKVVVNYRFALKAQKLAHKVNIGVPYDFIRKDIKELVYLVPYLDMLYEYTLPTSESEEDNNFLTPAQMRSTAVKINRLLNLAYNYDFINY